MKISIEGRTEEIMELLRRMPVELSIRERARTEAEESTDGFRERLRREAMQKYVKNDWQGEEVN